MTEDSTISATSNDHGRAHAHEHGHGHSHGHGHGHGHDHGPVDPDIVESRQGVRVLMISLVILAVTSIVQAIVVWYTGSVALLADTIHNVGDSLTSIPLAIAFVLSRRPPTSRFAWGLGRSEDLAGLMIVMLIAFSGVVAFVQSVNRLLHPDPPRYLLAGILAGVLGFIGNEAVAIYRIRQGRRMHSAALIADGKHARIDGYTSLSVAAGLLLVMAGFPKADPIIGLLISLVIAHIVWDTAHKVGIRLLDGIEPETLDPIRAVVERVLPDGSVRAIRGRWFGHVVHIEVEVEPSALGGSHTGELEVVLEQELRDHGTRGRRVVLVAARPTS